MKVKILQFGDLHLDAPFTSLSDEDGMPQIRRQELKRALGRIVELARSEKVDMVLVCGDLFEYSYVSRATVNYITAQFSKIIDIPVMIIPGNHDPITPDSYYSCFSWPSNVHILSSENAGFFDPGTGTRVYGSLSQAEHLDNNKINILMYHGTLDMPFSQDTYQPVSSELIDSYGFDYCALGHFHTKIRGAGSRKRIYNAGSPEPLGFDEEGSHGVFIADIDKPAFGESVVNVEFKPIGQRHFFNIEVDISSCRNDEEAAHMAIAKIDRAGNCNDLYRISFTGYCRHGYQVDKVSVSDFIRDKAPHIRIIDNTAPDYDFETIAEEAGLRGLFTRKMLERAEKAPTEEERRIVMQALYYGLEAIDEGKVCV